MAHFAGAGLGATLAPGGVWARMQDAGVQRINLAMVTEALKLSGIDLTEEERTALVEDANRNLTAGLALSTEAPWRDGGRPASQSLKSATYGSYRNRRCLACPVISRRIPNSTRRRMI